MDSIELFNALIESSSLRTDLLNHVGGVLKDILDSIEPTDELCARVSDETYKFIIDYKLKKGGKR